MRAQRPARKAARLSLGPERKSDLDVSAFDVATLGETEAERIQAAGVGVRGRGSKVADGGQRGPLCSCRKRRQATRRRPTATTKPRLSVPNVIQPSQAVAWKKVGRMLKPREPSVCSAAKATILATSSARRWAGCGRRRPGPEHGRRRSPGRKPSSPIKRSAGNATRWRRRRSAASRHDSGASACATPWPRSVDAFARHVELLADFLQRVVAAHVDPEAHPHHLRLPRRQTIEQLARQRLEGSTASPLPSAGRCRCLR